MRTKRLATKNNINARNTSHKAVEIRRKELEKARQQFQQNSLKVNSPSIVYYQQVKNGYACTCHADDNLISGNGNDIETGVSSVVSSPDVFEINLNTPLFGTTNLSSKIDATVSKEDIFDDSDLEDTSKSLFPDLFAKGTNCAICYRTGWVPLWHPVGRQRYVYSTHNIKSSDGYSINQGINPSLIQLEVTDGTAYIEYILDVPKYYKKVYTGIYNNTQLLKQKITNSLGEAITEAYLRSVAGTKISLKVMAVDFTHIVIEFDLGLEIQVNFPQFSIARDYSQFFSLQSVSIELPATISNAQVGDILFVPTWNRVWQITEVSYFVDNNTLVKTTAQARLVTPIETFHNLSTLTKLI